MEVKFSEEQLRLHNKLLTDISDQLDSDSAEYAAFRHQITKPLGGAGVLGRCGNLFDMFRQLSKRKKLDVLNYAVLKDAFGGSNNDDIVALIEEREQEIRIAADAPKVKPSGSSTPYNRKSEEFTAHDTRKDKAIRPDTEDIDPSDGKYISKENLGYYDTSRKTGFLLILHFYEDREGLDGDLVRLTEFFEHTLHFDVVIVPRANNPREKMVDLTSGQVTAALVAVRTYLNKVENARKYYCFMCVVLSHGDNGVIKTKDGFYNVDDIRNMFNNKEMQQFAAKPKIFVIQACQGDEEQDHVEVDDESDTEGDDKVREYKQPIDESDTIVSIPKDADVLFAFATTPGHSVPAGNILTDRGTYLIIRLVEIFRRSYERLHLEDMMISVRDETSQTECLDHYMMPFTWSTLTKRLQFTVGRRTWQSQSTQRDRQPFMFENESVLIDSVLAK